MLPLRSGRPMTFLSKRKAISLTLSQGDAATHLFLLTFSGISIETIETKASGILYSFASGVFCMHNVVAL
jgi:hypothetical protein